ncbi:glycerol-3-phosphate acyltransferase [Bacillus sp. 1P06AnD]|uniref:glycerol-3-phosphate acyltransferase n=1 Tax=Bacillus sp. 1P06AnD TaxID=3132208 RepID=UPI0039A05EF6
MVFLYVIGSYLIGNIMTAHIFISTIRKRDIRQEGSGNVGARNAGRVFGWPFFVLTFLADASKGAVIIWLGHSSQFDLSIQLIALGMGIVGHMYPVSTGFRGGKGVSTFIGGMLAIHLLSALIIIIGFTVVYAVSRHFSASGLASFFMIPVYVWQADRSIVASMICLCLVILIMYAHSPIFIERKRMNENKT